VRYRLRAKWWDSVATDGEKMRPIPIPTPIPCDRRTCQYSFDREAIMRQKVYRRPPTIMSCFR
jgi:hypothetical protein